MEPWRHPIHHAEWIPALCGSLWDRLWLGLGRALPSLPGTTPHTWARCMVFWVQYRKQWKFKTFHGIVAGLATWFRRLSLTIRAAQLNRPIGLRCHKFIYIHFTNLKRKKKLWVESESWYCFCKYMFNTFPHNASTEHAVLRVFRKASTCFQRRTGHTSLLQPKTSSPSCWCGTPKTVSVLPRFCSTLGSRGYVYSLPSLGFLRLYLTPINSCFGCKSCFVIHFFCSLH